MFTSLAKPRIRRSNKSGGLRIRLRDRGLRMPVNDSWIAATAIALRVPVVTQHADYVEVERLGVIRM